MEADNRSFPSSCFDGEDVKPPRRIVQAARAEELASHAREAAALFQINGILRRGLAWFSLRSSFHFHKCKDRAIVSDYVEFPLYSRHSEIPCNDNVTFATQVPVGVGFSAYTSPSRELFCG